MHVVDNALEQIALAELLDGSRLVLYGLPHPGVIRLFGGIVVNAHGEVFRVALIEQVALADNAPVALFQVGRPPGGIKMMCGHQTFLDIHASAHLAGGAEQDTNMAGIHVGKEFCLADIGVGLMDEGDFFRRNPPRDKFASYVVIDGKL